MLFVLLSYVKFEGMPVRQLNGDFAILTLNAKP